MPNNFTRIQDSIYIVRTQAGFKQSVKEFLGSDCSSEDFAEQILVGYPENYPSLVTITRQYRGFSFIACYSIHLRKLEAAIEQSELLFAQSLQINLQINNEASDGK